MTEKATRNVRVGCGHYAWAFDADPPNLAHRLVIVIAEMQIFPPAVASVAMSCLAGLTYPWASPAEVKGASSTYPLFEPIFQRLDNMESDAYPFAQAERQGQGARLA